MTNSSSSRKRRRPSGSALIRPRSSGANSTARTSPSRPRSRGTFCPWSRARLDLPGVISRSTCSGRPARRKLARITAVVSPRWTRAASWGTRWLERVDRYQTASTMFVLPCPFWPTRTVMPGCTGNVSRGYERWFVRSRAVSCTEGVSLRSDPHRHDQVLVRGVRSPFEGLLAAHHRWLDGVVEGQAGEVGTQGAQAVEQEPGVEADHQILPLELCLEHFAGLGVVAGTGLESHLALGEGQPHRGVALGDQGDALDGVDQGAVGNRGGDGGGLGEQPPHRRVLTVDQGRGGTPTAGLESDQVAVGVIGQGDVDAAAGGQGAGDIVQGPTAHQCGLFGAGGGGRPGELE